MTLVGGLELGSNDYGRPVTLIAAMLGVAGVGAATVAYTGAFETNGSLSAITLTAADGVAPPVRDSGAAPARAWLARGAGAGALPLQDPAPGVTSPGRSHPLPQLWGADLVTTGQRAI